MTTPSPWISSIVPVEATADTVPVPETRPAETPLVEPVRARGISSRYSLNEEVGRGGMGCVMRARDQVLLREVALKTVSAGTPEAEQRFREEARITGQLDHPNVLPVYDLGHDEQGRPFFTMKLVRGHASLADVIDRLREEDPATTSRYTYERRVQVIQAVCHALRYAHERGVIHRDIKPQNVVLGACGEVYLVDWGVARLLAEGSRVTAPVEAGPLAKPAGAEVTGTPAYMAPEQLLDGETDQVSDVYSLCAVLYELLTLNYYLGHVEEGLIPLGKAKKDRVPVLPEKFKDRLHGRIPRQLSRICEKGLAKERALRYQSAHELEEAIQRWIDGPAPIVCAGTCMQRVLTRWNYLIDQRPFVVPMISVLVGALVIGSLADTIGRLVRFFLGAG